MKMANETWIQGQCQEVEACLRKNNSKKAYQLVKDLTKEKQGKSTTIQDKSGKCLTEKNEILNGWTESCSDLYNYETEGDPTSPPPGNFADIPYLQDHSLPHWMQDVCTLYLVA